MTNTSAYYRGDIAPKIVLWDRSEVKNKFCIQQNSCMLD